MELRGLTDSVHLLGRYPLEAMNGFFAQADAMIVTLKKERAEMGRCGRKYCEAN